MIYTSYFSKLRYLPENMIPISISLKPPSWYKGHKYKALAPNWSILTEWRQTHDEDRYIQRFNEEILARLTAHGVYRDLRSLADRSCSQIISLASDIVLLCYERPSDFCHRHLVATWLTSNGYPCAEIQL